jgi:hypothetical protein
MNIETSKLIDKALDWAVAKSRGLLEPQDYYGKMIPRVVVCNKTLHDETVVRFNPTPDVYYRYEYDPSTNWEHGGIIVDQLIEEGWLIQKADYDLGIKVYRFRNDLMEIARGPTVLTAAMRCYVSSKLGDTVEIPDELI